ncbi:hypothetical protein GGH13_008708, partial [Coemansia sp. S155-1]
EDSDGEALWARISKDKAVDDLVPMLPTDTLASTRPPPLFIDPAALMVNNHHEEEEEEDEEEEEEEEDNAFSDSE